MLFGFSQVKGSNAQEFFFRVAVLVNSLFIDFVYFQVINTNNIYCHRILFIEGGPLFAVEGNK